MASAVLFDLDGTLIEFSMEYGLAKKIVISKLLELGVDKKILSESKPTALNLEDALNFIRSKGLDEGEIRRLRLEVYRAVEPLELKAVENSILRNDVTELLSSLREINVKTAICTNNCAKASEIILQRLSLKSFFDSIVTRDDVERLKPFPDILLKACRMLEVPVSKAIHVGDSPIDVMAALNADIRPIGILSGLYGAESLREAGAELIASDVRELREILLRLV
ncbi:MAG: HAD family hydrolase [Thermoproteota archaeon]